MFVDDCEEDEWLHGTGFDLVHLRELSGVLRDLDALLAGISKYVPWCTARSGDSLKAAQEP
jgi:hypothetical protein